MQFSRIRLIRLAMFFLVLIAISGCGGGSGDGSSKSKTKTAFKTSQLLPNGTTCTALELTLYMPGTVKVQTDTNGNPLPGVVRLIGAPATDTTLYIASYDPPGPGELGALKFGIVNDYGFKNNEYIELELDLTTAGVVPTATDFSFGNFFVWVLPGGDKVDLTGTLTVSSVEPY